MRSRCLMCANALAALAGENRSCASRGEANLEIIRSHSHKHYSALTVNGPGHLYGPPLREARKSFGVTCRAQADKLASTFLSLFDFPPVLFEVSIGPLLWQVQGRAWEKALAEGRSGTEGAGPQSPWPSKARPGPGGGWGWWPGALASVGSPHLGQSGPRPLGDCSGLFGTLLTYPSGLRSAHPQSPL